MSDVDDAIVKLREYTEDGPKQSTLYKPIPAIIALMVSADFVCRTYAQDDVAASINDEDGLKASLDALCKAILR